MRLVIIYLLAVATIACAATPDNGLIASPEPDWPQWRGPRRDGISNEKGLLQSWPEGGPELLWKADDLGKGWSSPIIVGDAFSQGRLYNLNAHGRLACLDAASGDEVWTVNILERFDGKNITWALSECVLVDGPRVIVTPSGKKALMAALDKRDGRTIWTTDPLAEDRATHCSPILFRYGGRRVIANCSSAHGLGVDADTGNLLWTVPLKNRFGTNISTPVYDSGRIFFVTPYTQHGRLYSLIANEKGIAADHIWTNLSLDTVTGSGVLVDGLLFSAGYKKSKWWFAVDWKTGKTKYELKDFTTGAAIHADNRLYCLDEQGNAGLLKIAPDKLEIKGRFSITEKRVKDAWTHPVLLDSRLYLRYHDTLFCYDVKGR